jgi:dethiobiotin synthetase
MPARIIFVTATDTGVGKTLLTALLLLHLRQTGCQALAIKPFCCGPRADAELLQALQDGELTLKEINPFYFREPLAPLVAARKGRPIGLTEVLTRIQSVGRHCECLLIEGCGGLLVPLGKGYTGKDLIAKLACEVLLVSRNRLGTINHTLLTVSALQETDHKELKIVLMNTIPDLSSGSNPRILAKLLAPRAVFPLPFLGRRVMKPGALKKNAKKLKKTLARLLS